ncbi:MAG TPA: class I SAM-dependent methyltransferase, partial [Planctomycetota bacterium]|nr:class I SAM-dependent methyltransferase [Planctomycetota bacterium]
AFVYRWRLWTPAELGEAMVEAGFGAPEFHARLGDAEDPPVPVRDAAELGPPEERWSVLLAARAEP